MVTNRSIRAALLEAQQALNHEAKTLESQLLLGKVLGKNRAWLIAHDDNPLTESEHQTYKSYIQQRQQGYPIAYLLEQQEFWSLELCVTPATLIPRPETECLVEAVLEQLGAEPKTIVDLGTGSGAIALALASERGQDTILGIDNSPAAARVARGNQLKHQLDNVQFLIGSWCDAIGDQSIDFIVSNPPYVELNDQHLQQLRFEPMSALTSGADGLTDIRSICADAVRCLKPGGKLAIEHGFNQQARVIDICHAHHFQNVVGYKDLQGQPRFVIAEAI